MKLKSLNETPTLFGHSAYRRRYLDRFPSQYFRNKKPKIKKKIKN